MYSEVITRDLEGMVSTSHISSRKLDLLWDTFYFFQTFRPGAKTIVIEFRERKDPRKDQGEQYIYFLGTDKLDKSKKYILKK